MSEEMYAQIEESCQKTGCTIMEWIRRACKERLQRGEFADLPVNSLSYQEIEHLVKRALNNVLEERLNELDREIESGVKNKNL